MKPDLIEIIVNGQPEMSQAGTTVADYVVSRGVKLTQVVIEHNGDVLARSLAAQVPVKQGDRLEIIIPVAGG